MRLAATSKMSPEHRAVLGYHRLAKESNAVRSYDRTKQLGPVSVLMEHLQNYRGEEDFDGEVLDGDDVSCSDSSSSSDSDSDDGVPIPKVNIGLILNEARGTLHRSRAEDLTKTICGFQLKGHYRDVEDEKASSTWMRCRRGCFKGEPDKSENSSDSSR